MPFGDFSKVHIPKGMTYGEWESDYGPPENEVLIDCPDCPFAPVLGYFCMKFEECPSLRDKKDNFESYLKRHDPNGEFRKIEREEKHHG